MHKFFNLFEKFSLGKFYSRWDFSWTLRSCISIQYKYRRWVYRTDTHYRVVYDSFSVQYYAPPSATHRGTQTVLYCIWVYSVQWMGGSWDFSILTKLFGFSNFRCCSQQSGTVYTHGTVDRMVVPYTRTVQLTNYIDHTVFVPHCLSAATRNPHGRQCTSNNKTRGNIIIYTIALFANKTKQYLTNSIACPKPQAV
jgi:hypothetical protein